MRLRHKVDRNQAEVVAALRAVGASVEVASGVGKGFPDLVVGYRGKTFLLEVKDGQAPVSQRVLTPDQASWHQKWRGHAAVVESAQEALVVVTIR